MMKPTVTALRGYLNVTEIARWSTKDDDLMMSMIAYHF